MRLIMVRHRDPRGQTGLTVVELLVTMTILGVVLSALTAGVISIYRASFQVDLGSANQAEARNAMTVLSRDIRTASPVRPSTQSAFLVATPTGAEFTANLDDSQFPQLVRLSIDGDSRLVEDATPATVTTDPGTGEVTVSWDPADSNVRFVAAFVVNDATLPLFRFFESGVGGPVELVPQATGTCPRPDGGTPTPAPCLDEGQRNRVSIVELNLTISSDPSGRVGQFTVSQRIRLPNTL